ncbi:MAG: ABC transporter permease [Xanthomonadales bacterium]|nr:ABC transporter permease [Xanthomonadales bacterium]
MTASLKSAKFSSRYKLPALGTLIFIGFIGILLTLAVYPLAEWQTISPDRFAGISLEHPLGTNALGQDIASRAEKASWHSLRIGFLVALCAGLLGVSLGLLSGWYAGRWPDTVILWLTGVMEAIPFYLFVAALAYALRQFNWSMELAMVITFWTTMARLIRAEVIRLKQRDFILSARAIGLSPGRTLTAHILPNTLPVLLVQLSMIFIAAIKAEVILSFLGLGNNSNISWGQMISESTHEVISGHYMNFVSASILLFMLIYSISLITDSLQTRSDPRQGIA